MLVLTLLLTPIPTLTFSLALAYRPKLNPNPTLTRAFNIPVHDPDKIATRAQHVFQELGLSGFIYYLREGVVLSLEGHAMQLTNVSQPGAQHKRRLLLERLPRLRREMQLAAERLEQDGELTRCDFGRTLCLPNFALIT